MLVSSTGRGADMTLANVFRDAPFKSRTITPDLERHEQNSSAPNNRENPNQLSQFSSTWPKLPLGNVKHEL
jgi:hypothetical protein